MVSASIPPWSLGAAGSNALVLLLLDIHHYGFLIAQIFFGLWLLPLGYLAYRSGMFPKALGLALIVGGACYLVGMLAAFSVPDFGEKISGIVTIPCTVAEVWMLGYLLVFGVRKRQAGRAHLRRGVAVTTDRQPTGVL